VGGKDLGAFADPAIECAASAVVDHDGQRARAEEMAAHVHLGQTLAQFGNRGGGGVIDEHVFGSGLCI
jgi:hypothetical protein